MPDYAIALANPVLQASLTGFTTALAVLLVLTGINRLFTPGKPRRAGSGLGRLVFEGRYLIAADGGAKEDFARCTASGDDWTRTVAFLGPNFPSLSVDQPPVALELARISSTDGRCRMEIFRKDGIVTLSFHRQNASDECPNDNTVIEDSGHADLRAVAQAVPFPIWMQDAEGRITWVNSTYIEMVNEAFPGGEGAGWPPPDIFDQAAMPRSDRPDQSVRLAYRRAGPELCHWYDVRVRPSGTRRVYTAVNVDAAVRAEDQLRDFTQTLAKTFAHLTIGLAIFDRSRRLILFNPALVDLTALSPEFLSSRPTLVGVLDGLRERRIVPEPRDYVSWRRKLADLEAAALDGSYEETWSLPTGQTYRVTGRPHPDGAVIFLFEDISAEVSLTRRFRAELEIAQSVLDSLDEAMAVFTADGVLAMTNAEYARLWGHDPEAELSGLSLNDVTASWLARTAPTPAWGDFRDFARQSQGRAEWSADVIMQDGRLVFCRFVPLAGRATLAAFRPRRAEDLRSDRTQRWSA